MIPEQWQVQINQNESGVLFLKDFYLNQPFRNYFFTQNLPDNGDQSE